MENQLTQPERQAISEMVLRLYVGRFLRADLTGDEMIDVFDLVEQNPDGKSRIHTLIEKGYTRDLTEQQIAEAIWLVEDCPEFTNGNVTKEAILEYLAEFQAKQIGKKSLTERVVELNKSGWLFPGLTAGNMICVFDLIEHNDDGEARLNRLIEEECVIVLNDEQTAYARELLNDFSGETK